MTPAWRMPPPSILRIRTDAADQRRRARHDRADRRGQALGQAELDGVGRRGELGGRSLESHGRVEDPGTVEVEPDAVAAGELGHPRNVRGRQDRAAAPIVSILQADHGGHGELRVVGIVGERRGQAGKVNAAVGLVR